MPLKTPLYQAHIESGARMVDFGGWEMPINYGSQIEEHHVIRQSAGMFDVSHMTVVDLNGDQTRPFLSYLLANDVSKLQHPGKAFYSCMLLENGGVIDDLITYFLNENFFRVVVNASTREKDLAWIRKQAVEFSVSVTERPDLAMIAVQGPEAREAVIGLLEEKAADELRNLGSFFAGQFGEMFIARTGYTGEDGFEISLPAQAAVELWNQLLDIGVKPCGLGARDTLRLEAGMNLYGQDMDETVSPLESGLAWTVALNSERPFIGRNALETQRANGVNTKLVGLVLHGKGVLRHGQKVVTDEGDGVLTSGSFSPTLQRSIGLARIPAGINGSCQVEIRDRLLDAKIVKPPFARAGNVCEGMIE
jgi:aminomethyltransferase